MQCQKLLATNLKGHEASAESLTPQRSSLVMVDALDFQFDSISSLQHESVQRSRRDTELPVHDLKHDRCAYVVCRMARENN